MKFSGFTIVHNALVAGYPLVEAIASVKPFVDEVVVVDMESDDGTSELLASFNVKTIKGTWENTAGQILSENFQLNLECTHPNIVFFEADEIWEASLLRKALDVKKEAEYVGIWRIQVEQNFQRIKWYPHPVTRVFPRGKATKQGETLVQKAEVLISEHYGFLWDISNCFRDQFIQRKEQMAQWWNNSEPSFHHVPEHFLHEPSKDLDILLKQKHWLFTNTPLNIPTILNPHVGSVVYNPSLPALTVCKK